MITPEELAAGTDITVLSSTTQGHAHFVLITAADFDVINAGGEVVKKSCAGSDHGWVINCGSTGNGFGEGGPDCSDECGDGTTPENACR